MTAPAPSQNGLAELERRNRNVWSGKKSLPVSSWSEVGSSSQAVKVRLSSRRSTPLGGIGAMRNMARQIGFLALLIVSIGAGPADERSERAGGLNLETLDAGFFKVDVPQGWRVTPAGSCDTFGFLLRDPERPSRQVFFISMAGPLYLSQNQKNIDRQYMSMGGYPVQWYEMPVVDPLTPENFLRRFRDVARTRIAQGYLPGLPSLERLELLSSTPTPTPFGSAGGRAALMRALFAQDGELCEGLFHTATVPLIPSMGGPGGGIAYALWFVGTTAPQRELRRLESDLIRCVRSFELSRSYVEQCMRQQQAAFEGVMRAGQTLRESSDLIIKGWEQRSRVDDILSEKRSDAMLGRERLHSESTGEVYEFENGFYDRYQLDPGKYRLDDLKPLPDGDYGLWTRAPLNGPGHL